MPCGPFAQQRRRADDARAPARHDLVERGDAVQVGIDRDQRVDHAGQQRGDVALAHRLAGHEGHVLAHVGQVGAGQRHGARAELARRGHADQQLDQAVVGRVQPAQQQHLGRQCRRQPQLGLAVGKAVALDPGQRYVERARQVARQRRLVGKRQQHCRIHRAPLPRRRVGICAAMPTLSPIRPVPAIDQRDLRRPAARTGVIA